MPERRQRTVAAATAGSQGLLIFKQLRHWRNYLVRVPEMQVTGLAHAVKISAYPYHGIGVACLDRLQRALRRHRQGSREGVEYGAVAPDPSCNLRGVERAV